jgi:2-(1,2-epoxy-1,2-dihydrophenyl)acetyl-CoA isomerase
MTYQTLEFDLQDNVARITFNRPERFNAMNLALMRELLDAAERCQSEAAVRAVVLTGAGEKAFSAGGDVADFAAGQDHIARLLEEMTGYFHQAVSRFARMDAPVIAAVNGVAAGAGLSMVACCDLVLAAESATFTSAYTRIGLAPDGSSTYFLPRLLGVRRAMELYLTNRVLSAREALDWGLVNQVVPANALMKEAHKLAARLAEGPTRAYGGVKKLMQMTFDDSLEAQMARETRMIADLGTSADGREGVRAFAEKRKPSFTGT